MSLGSGNRKHRQAQGYGFPGGLGLSSPIMENQTQQKMEKLGEHRDFRPYTVHARFWMTLHFSKAVSTAVYSCRLSMQHNSGNFPIGLTPQHLPKESPHAGTLLRHGRPEHALLLGLRLWGDYNHVPTSFIETPTLSHQRRFRV